MENKEKIDYLLTEISKLTNSINNKNLFKGVFTIEEIKTELQESVQLELNLVYTQLNLDNSEYIPSKSAQIFRKRYNVLSEDNIEDFYNQFYSDIIRSLTLGIHPTGVSFFSYIINNGLDNE